MYCMAMHAGPHKKGPFPSDSWAGWVSEESACGPARMEG